ncbi:MAG: hypothetical protein HC888_00975 [Candidatus Competibacteraceae bacterium]|nr:hypothetical protein [Candidatus Competibacteraceae bacterium]
MENYIRKTFTYDPTTGSIYRTLLSGRVKETGHTPTRNGYGQVNVQGNMVRTHRLAWFLHYGEWPPYDIDHINGKRLDNRITNLRSVPSQENIANKHPRIVREVATTPCRPRSILNKDGQYEFIFTYA